MRKRRLHNFGHICLFARLRTEKRSHQRTKSKRIKCERKKIVRQQQQEHKQSAPQQKQYAQTCALHESKWHCMRCNGNSDRNENLYTLSKRHTHTDTLEAIAPLFFTWTTECFEDMCPRVCECEWDCIAASVSEESFAEE